MYDAEIKQAASLTERDNKLAHYFALFGGLGLAQRPTPISYKSDALRLSLVFEI